MPEELKKTVTLFLCGDVMTGRGVDQALPHPSPPRIYEPFVTDARTYLELAEMANGPINKPVGFDYVWGDALEELRRARPDARIINLETSVTRSEDYWEGKPVLYRMHPLNVPILTTAGIDVCALANNHVLDWGYRGLEETLDTLARAGIAFTGAGSNINEAQAPAMLDMPERGRVIVFSYASGSAGTPMEWAAAECRPGVNYLDKYSEDKARLIGRKVGAVKKDGDIAVFSVHWGSNWGYDIPSRQRKFARMLIDMAGIDVIHGHSSHHPRPVEVYKGKLVIFGAGDFISDYEGISGYERYRGELSLMYFATFEASSGRLVFLRMVPMRMRNFRLGKASAEDTAWLAKTLTREGRAFGTGIRTGEDYDLRLEWE